MSTSIATKVAITILGCGTSTGVPLMQCRCKVCRSRNPKNKRLRSSARVLVADSTRHGSKPTSLLIDTSPDLREQAFRFGVDRVDAVLYTHAHADHCHGIDELRNFNYLQKATIPVYGAHWTIEELTERFPYIFRPGKIEGGGIPALSARAIDPNAEFEAAGVRVLPVRLQHGSHETLGYRIGSFAYAIDCNAISDASLARLRDLSVLVLDCLKIEPHQTHMHLAKSLEIAAELKAKKTYLTHLGHDFDYTSFGKKLPKGVALAYDGLKIRA